MKDAAIITTIVVGVILTGATAFTMLTLTIKGITWIIQNFDTLPWIIQTFLYGILATIAIITLIGVVEVTE